MGKLVSPDSLTPHPTLRETIPALSEDEYQDLKASIKTFGIQQDIVVDSAGFIIDGYNRWRAATELGFEKVSVFPNNTISPEMAERLGIELNANRRQWTRDQRRTAIIRLLKLEPDRTDRAIARSAGVDNKTVAVVRAELIESEEIPHFPQRRDPRTGKQTQPSVRKNRVDTLTAVSDEAGGYAMDIETNGAGPSDFKRAQGPSLSLPDGVTPEQAVRSMAEFRRNGGSIVDASVQIGVHAENFRFMERIIALVDRTDLAADDAELAKSAMAQLNETRQVTPAYRRIVDLYTRVYGDPSSRTQNLDRRASQRSDAFDRGCGALIEACSRAETMEVPYLSPERARVLDAELARAVGQIRALRDRIKEYKR